MPAAGVLMIAGGISAGVGTVAGMAMLVGGVMSTVGYITENEDLTKAGSVIGLVGGVAGAMGAGGAAAETAGTDLATGSATKTAADVTAGTGAAGTSAYTGTASELAADGLGGVESGIMSQTTTPATQVGGAATPAAEAIGTQPTTYTGTGQQLADNVSKWSNTGVTTSSGGIADTIKGVVSSKEFWGAATQVVGGALKGMGDSKIANANIDLAKDQAANASAVPELGNRLSLKKPIVPSVYIPPEVKAPATSIMGGK